jgi:tellurite methyltransferase
MARTDPGANPVGRVSVPRGMISEAMRETPSDTWYEDAGYSACPCFWGTAPSSLVQLLSGMTDIDGLVILDAGCGEGKNAAFASARGASVLAVDISHVALQHGRQQWPDLTIEWSQADIQSLSLSPRTFDVVIAYGLLHCLTGEDEITMVVRNLQESTKPGGFHCVCALNARAQRLGKAHAGFDPCLLPHAAYADLYEDWKVIVSTDSDLSETHPHDGIRHTHSLTRLLAQAP